MVIARHDNTSGMSRCVVNGDMVYLAGLTAADRLAEAATNWCGAIAFVPRSSVFCGHGGTEWNLAKDQFRPSPQDLDQAFSSPAS